MRVSDSYVFDGERSSVLLASTTWWPSCAKLAVAFVHHGCKVEVVCPSGHPFEFMSGIRKRYPYRVLDSLGSLCEAITLSRPDLVISCDDGVVWQMHELHRTRPELRPLIERSLGAPASYEVVASRAKAMQLAQELGIRVAETKGIATASDLRDWFSVPGALGVMKLDGTCAGKGVQIVSSLAEAEHALATMHRPPSTVEACGRWFAIRDAMALWNWKNHKPPVFTIQKFITGRPANMMMACRDGKVLAAVTVEVLWAQGATGPASVVRLIENDEIQMAAERLAERLQLAGFHGLDFMLEDETEHAYLIELNPRCTQLGHLRIEGQGDLAGVLCGASTDASLLQDHRAVYAETIAFFPQALMSNPRCPYLESSYIDVPWEEPQLVRELIRRDWRDRRLLVRLYHAIRPPSRTMVDFEAMVRVREAKPAAPTNVSLES
jgi:ATP-grasp domain